MSILVKHLEREWEICGFNNIADEMAQAMQNLMKKQLKETLEIISSHGHSGFSLNLFMDYLQAIVRLEPLTPITDKTEEWLEVSTNVFQNVRCGSVFRDEKGFYFNNNAYVFIEPDGCAFTSRYSRKQIILPYTYKRPVVLKLPKISNEMTEEDYKKLIADYEAKQ